MYAYVTVMCDGLCKIELSPQNSDDEDKLRELQRRGFFARTFGSLGNFDGVEMTLRPEIGRRTVLLGTEELKFTCPSKITDGPPSAGRQHDDSH